MENDTSEAAEGSNQGAQENNTEEANGYACPACDKTFTTGNKLYFHYMKMHAVCDPDLVTTLSKQCMECEGFFARWEDWKGHVCPARQISANRANREIGSWVPVKLGPTLVPPMAWHIATDGSGRSKIIEGNTVKSGGQGAVIFRWPVISRYPDYVLHAQVIAEPWDPLWIGARDLTNNTGELSAIGEVML